MTIWTLSEEFDVWSANFKITLKLQVSLIPSQCKYVNGIMTVATYNVLLLEESSPFGSSPDISALRPRTEKRKIKPIESRVYDAVTDDMLLSQLLLLVMSNISKINSDEFNAIQEKLKNSIEKNRLEVQGNVLQLSDVYSVKLNKFIEDRPSAPNRQLVIIPNVISSWASTVRFKTWVSPSENLLEVGLCTLGEKVISLLSSPDESGDYSFSLPFGDLIAKEVLNSGWHRSTTFLELMIIEDKSGHDNHKLVITDYFEKSSALSLGDRLSNISNLVDSINQKKIEENWTLICPKLIPCEDEAEFLLYLKSYSLTNSNKESPLCYSVSKDIESKEDSAYSRLIYQIY